jgi:hypothetical protein
VLGWSVLESKKKQRNYFYLKPKEAICFEVFYSACGLTFDR